MYVHTHTYENVCICTYIHKYIHIHDDYFFCQARILGRKTDLQSRNIKEFKPKYFWSWEMSTYQLPKDVITHILRTPSDDLMLT